MKKISLSVLMLASVSSLTFAQTKQPALELNYMDTSIRPQDDFYNYVNGTWMKTAKIPADKPSWGSFTQLRETTDNNSLGLLDNILKEKFATGSEGQKIQALYETYMDMAKRNADGINPVKGDLAKIDAIKSVADLQKYLIEATRRGENAFYGWGVDGDLKDSKMNAVYLGDASFGLGRDYYQKDSPKNTETIEEYKKYVAKVLTVAGYKNSTAVAAQIVNFEE
ncbi:MAG: M13 family peptidase, partial [Chryseobacterium sp.]|nr:M13 family peptidase [Chryseobacterium sp.]